MGKAYENVGTLENSNIIADGVHPVDTKQVELATGTETLKQWSLINDTGALCSASSDKPVGILCEETDLSSSLKTNSIMYTSGSFYASKIVVGSSVTIKDFELELQKLGIYLR